MAAGTLSGAVALVTGGGGGIGRALCSRLARQGALVAVSDRNEAAARETLRALPPAAGGGGRPHVALEADVTSAAGVRGLLQRVQEHFGAPPNVCVGCAGITRDQFLLRMEEREFREVLEVNLLGSFLLSQAMAEALVAAGAPGGSIVLVGSIVGKVGNLGQSNYAAAKAGIEGLTRSCAKELARAGIRVNAVLPGFIVTPMTSTVPPKVLSKFAGMVPLGRLGQPEDVADVIEFLASERSSYVTGASVEVTGGLFM
ncbi:(3R)-3-hydroxyacyl-CoA dehydrogenase isoform 2-T2 [Amazona ochrocephala]